MWGPHGGNWRHVHQATATHRWGSGRSLGGSGRGIGLSRRRLPPETPSELFLSGFFGWILLPFLLVVALSLIGLLLEWWMGREALPWIPPFGWLLVVGSTLYWIRALWSAPPTTRGRVFLILGSIGAHAAVTFAVLFAW